MPRLNVHENNEAYVVVGANQYHANISYMSITSFFIEMLPEFEGVLLILRKLRVFVLVTLSAQSYQYALLSCITRLIGTGLSSTNVLQLFVSIKGALRL